jgi:3',5'-cyclic AMP phosphodiesterase CpdA
MPFDKNEVLESYRKDAIVALHLSDLHWIPGSDPNGGCFLHLTKRLTELAQEKRLDASGNAKPFDLVLVTGDLVDNSKLSSKKRLQALEEVKRFLLNLCNQWSLNDKRALVVIPGNHDYRWFGITGDTIAKAAFKEFFQQWMTHRLIEFREARMKLLIACFDSIFKKGDNARGYVDPDEIARVGKDISNATLGSEVIRLALVHHHPLPVWRAETQKKVHILDYIFGRRLVGGDEYMLLRNSGIFLKNLLEKDFRLVLHGHLHESGYWRALTRTNSDEDKWLEVLSGASAGRVDRANRYSFNSITIYRDGFIEGEQYAFDEEGQSEPRKIIPFTPYSVIRTSRAQLIRDEQELPKNLQIEATRAASEKYVQFWDVHLAQGDYTSTEIHHKFRAIDKPVDKVIGSTASIAMTLTDDFGKKISGSSVISWEKPKQGENGIQFEIGFSPPLEKDTPHDFVTTYNYRGIMFRSKEDQIQLGAKQKDWGWDQIGQTIQRPTEQLYIKLRFFLDEQDPWVPEVQFEVRDIFNNLCKREMNGDHVFFDYPSKDVLEIMGKARPVEAILSVYKPRVSYKYILKWALPDKDRVHEPVMSLTRRRLLSSRLKGGVEARQRANTLIKNLFACANEFYLTHFETSLKHNDVGYLFIVKERDLPLQIGDKSNEPFRVSEMVCAESTGDLDRDPIAFSPVAYGKNVVGTCFRRREPVYFSLADRALEVFENVPNAYHYLIALPLADPGNPGLPIAVFALGSREETSALHKLIQNKEGLNRLTEKLREYWLPRCAEILS